MSNRAFTLVEVLAVVLILAIVGLGATLFSGGANRDLALEASAREVAEALRFARSEALRVGAPRGVEVLGAPGRVDVFEPNLAGGSIGGSTLLTDPLSKHPYSFLVSEAPGAKRVRITDLVATFEFAGLGRRPRVLFDAQGIPFYLQTGARHPLTSAQVTLGLDGAQRLVRLSPVGRVTVE